MADIVLRDRNGKPVEYPGVDVIKVNTIDGGVQNFGAYDPDTLTPEVLAEGVTVGDVTGALSVPVLLEGLAIELDFSGGDQPVAAPDGYAVKTATIQQPANLVPANIAEGVDIAGIIGTLVAGGGGGSALIASGKVTTTAGPQTIDHNLGVVPDLVILTANLWDITFPRVRNVLGISSAFAALCGYNFCFYTYETSTSSSTTVSSVNANDAIDIATSGPKIYNATTTQFSVGSSSYNVNSGSQWVAIGGLT